MDAIDDQILRILQIDGRITNRELGDRVGLSTAAAGQRVHRLIESGIITGFHASVNHAAIGRPIEASIDVWVEDPRNPQAMYDFVTADSRVIECFHATGTADFRTRARLASTEDLRELLIGLKGEAGAKQTDSRVILEQVDCRAQG